MHIYVFSLKMSGSSMDTFSSAFTSHRSVWKHKMSVRRLVTDWGIQVILIAILLVPFGAHMNFSFSIKVKILFPINMRSPLIMLIIELRMVNKS